MGEIIDLAKQYIFIGNEVSHTVKHWEVSPV